MNAYNCQEKTMRFALLPAAVLLSCSLLSSGFPALGQGGRNNDSHFYQGASQGVRGGNYGHGRYHEHNYYDNRNQGGIGPGKGALIGGAAGAVLGAAFGGGVKGSLITGAAGAGIGAVIGQAAQNNRNNNNYYHR
jgi:outer membrane lipoprotein SlyB